MKKRYILNIFLGFLFSSLSWAQVVTTEPAIVKIDQPVTLYFHADQGSKGLNNFAGDVYAHTGVITSASTSGSDWKHAPTWLDNSAKYKLTKVSTNLFSLTISNISTYYNLNQGEKVLKLAFVFRSSDGSKEGKTASGGDIFVDVTDKSVAVKFTQPSSTFLFATVNQSIAIQGVAATSGSDLSFIKLYIDNIEKYSTTNDTINYLHVVEVTGKSVVKIVAKAENGDSDSASFTYIVNAAVVNQSLPQNVRDGINFDENGKVTLSLFAPYKKFVYVIGDFNNWEISPDYYMKRDSIRSDSVRWWIELNGLDPNTEYGFQYLVDGQVNVADPYAEKILDPWNDSYIPPSVYPNLKPYPTGKTDQAVGVFKINETKYQWKTQNYVRPDKRDLMIYEMLVRDFVASHSYQTIIDTLGYFKRLGINAIELMPVNEFEGNESWGYNPSFHLALDKYYGTKNKFKELIDSCHAKGIAVILDVVLNHTLGQSPLVRLWASGTFGPPTAENPYTNVTAKHPYNVGTDLNHESTATKYFAKRVMEYWLTEYKVDGFRFDLSKGFTQHYSTDDAGMSAYDASRIAIWKDYANFIRSVDNNAFIILEHFAANAEEIELSNNGMMIWGNMNNNYNQATMGYTTDTNFSGVSYLTRGWSQSNLVGYMESHDEQRLMYKNITYGNTNGAYNTKVLGTALDRMKLAASLFFTIPGPKMIWQFGELGYDIDINYNGRTGNKPIRWDYYSVAARKNLYKTYAALLKLRNENKETFRSSNFILNTGASNGLNTLKLTDAAMNVAIVTNFSVTDRQTTFTFPSTGKWYSYFTGDSLDVTNADVQFFLPAGAFRIFTTKKLTTPEPGIAVGVEEQLTNTKPKNLVLDPNYPNPFNPTTTITFSVPNSGMITLKVFDLLGREIRTLVNQYKTIGNYQVEFDASDLSSGVYLYQLKSENQVINRKMTILK